MDVLAGLHNHARRLAERLERRRILRDEGLRDDPVLITQFLRDLQVVRALRPPPFDTLVDVGAHRGIFTRAVRLFFPVTRAVCIEPLAELHEDLRANATGLALSVHGCALAEEAGSARFYVHGSSPMSSLVPADDDVLREKFAYDDPSGMRTMTVETRTLDQVVGDEALPSASRLFLKVDTQGNELDVLRGGEETLQRTDVVLVEHMFLSPYERRHAFAELLAFLEERGLDLACPLSLSRQASHEISAADFLFVRRAGAVGLS